MKLLNWEDGNSESTCGWGRGTKVHITAQVGVNNIKKWFTWFIDVH